VAQSWTGSVSGQGWGLTYVVRGETIWGGRGEEHRRKSGARAQSALALSYYGKRREGSPGEPGVLSGDLSILLHNTSASA